MRFPAMVSDDVAAAAMIADRRFVFRPVWLRRLTLKTPSRTCANEIFAEIKTKYFLLWNKNKTIFDEIKTKQLVLLRSKQIIFCWNQIKIFFAEIKTIFAEIKTIFAEIKTEQFFRITNVPRNIENHKQ
jgi:hypothetical protein